MSKSYLEQARAYARMLGKPFTYRSLMSDLGMSRRVALRALATLKDEGEIVNIGRPKEGIYRASTPQQKARILREKRERGRALLLEKGEQWHKRLLAL